MDKNTEKLRAFNSPSKNSQLQCARPEAVAEGNNFAISNYPPIKLSIIQQDRFVRYQCSFSTQTGSAEH